MIGLLVLCALLQIEVLETVDHASVVGADTIMVGDVSVRLWGLSPFPPPTSCSDQPAVPQSCSEFAHQILEGRLSSAREGLDLVSQQGHPRFATRPHLRCTILERVSEHELVGKCEVLVPSCYGTQCEEVWYDLARELIENGGATQRQAESLGTYDEEERIAREAQLGGWAARS